LQEEVRVSRIVRAEERIAKMQQDEFVLCWARSEGDGETKEGFSDLPFSRVVGELRP
jgi:hypothetical protein